MAELKEKLFSEFAPVSTEECIAIVTARHIGVRILEYIFRRTVVQECVHRTELPGTSNGLDKEILHPEDFIVRTEGKSMISLIPGKIVLKCVNILIQGVCS